MIKRALQALPEANREVVALRLIEGLSLPAVATRLGMTEATARHRLRKGSELYRARLRDAITDPGQSESLS